MNKITLCSNRVSDITVVSNLFIDKYMPLANGAYVKVYLYLLRCLSGSHSNDLTVSDIADNLGDTEADIIRALSYWEKVNLISVERTGNNEISGIMINQFDDSIRNDREKQTILEKPSSTGTQKNEETTKTLTQQVQDAICKEIPTPDIMEDKELQFVVSIAEKYIERTLSPNDQQLVLYLYTKAGFSPDLILELYEYCASQGKKKYQYIEAVASAWIAEGIDSVDKAKTTIDNFNADYKAVVKEFGLTRALGQAEKDFIKKWIRNYLFDIGIIREACSRTLLTIQKPDFKYADRILNAWFEKNVKSLADIQSLDEDYTKTNVQPLRTQSKPVAKKTTNKFNSFSQREYSNEDFDELERRLLSR